MFKRNKVETIKFADFMKGEVAPPKPTIDRKKVVRITVTAGVVLLSLGFGDVSMAAAGAVNGAITDRVVTAFNPAIELAQALSYPVGMLMMLGGGLYMMIGSSEKGLGMIQKAGMGYILVQMLPMFMDLLVEIAKAL